MDNKEEQIILQVQKLFAGADERNWKKVKSVMHEQVLLDYSSMTGNPAKTLTPQDICDAWSQFLPGFDRTNHVLSQFNVEANDKEALVRYFGKADHYLGGELWTVDGSYETRLICKSGGWLIQSQTFKFEKQDGEAKLAGKAIERTQLAVLREQNKALVNQFFEALETQDFEILKEIFAEDAKQLNPYSPEGFPKSFDGAEAIYKQYSGLTANFGQMKFPREIMATENPNFIFVKFKGQIQIKSGGKYENDYLGTFLVAKGKIVEYTEYFNQIVMAKAFNIELK